MLRINTTNKAVDLFGAGKHGYQGGNPSTGQAATELSFDAMNALQEEIAAAIEGSGAVLNPASNGQLLAAIKAHITSAQIGGFRNKIINGDMSISQVNGGTAVIPLAGNSYPIDQWRVALSQPSKLTFQQVTDAPAGFKYSLKVTVAAQYAPLATETFNLSQPIEGQNIVDFQLGTAGAVTLATSNWIKGSVAGTYAVSITNAGGTRAYVGTVNVTTTWAKVVVTLIGDTTGLWATDNTAGLYWVFDLGSGSNYNTTANIWQAASFVRTAGTVTFVNQVAGSTLNITGVQLEQVSPGATQGTAFEHVSFADQLRWCQRYLPCFTVSNYSLNLQAIDTASAYGSPLTFPVKTRVPVTGLVAIGTPQATKADGTSGGGTFSVFQAGDSVPTLRMTGCTGLFAGNASTIIGMSVVYFTGAQL